MCQEGSIVYVGVAVSGIHHYDRGQTLSNNSVRSVLDSTASCWIACSGAGWWPWPMAMDGGRWPWPIAPSPMAGGRWSWPAITVSDTHASKFAWMFGSTSVFFVFQKLTRTRLFKLVPPPRGTIAFSSSSKLCDLFFFCLSISCLLYTSPSPRDS